jgi:hypothetical protein
MIASMELAYLVDDMIVAAADMSPPSLCSRHPPSVGPEPTPLEGGADL